MADCKLDQHRGLMSYPAVLPSLYADFRSEHVAADEVVVSVSEKSLSV